MRDNYHFIMPPFKIKKIREKFSNLTVAETMALRIWRWKTSRWLFFSLIGFLAYVMILRESSLATEIVLFIAQPTQGDVTLEGKEALSLVLNIIGAVVGIFAAYYWLVCGLTTYASFNRDYAPRNETDIGFQVRCLPHPESTLCQIKLCRFLYLSVHFAAHYVFSMVMGLIILNLLFQLFFTTIYFMIGISLSSFGLIDANPMFGYWIVANVVFNIAAILVLELLVSMPIILWLLENRSKSVYFQTQITHHPIGNTH